MSDGEESPPSLPEALISLKAGLPVQVQRCFWKVVARVFTAAAEVPAVWLEGRARIH